MKVDTSRLKKGTSEVPPDCNDLINSLRECSRKGLIKELSKIKTWTYGKCELYHWIEVLDVFDTLLDESIQPQNNNEWSLTCDVTFIEKDLTLLMLLLNFTTLLIEHSFSRHLYNSMEHLTRLLLSNNMDIVLAVLNVLYMFSKRSNFISRLNSTKKNALLARLTHISESWGGKNTGYSLTECCSEDLHLPRSASTFYYEYYNREGTLDSIELPNLHSSQRKPADLTKQVCCDIEDDLDDEQKCHIFTRLRLTLGFHRFKSRLQFVQARLQAFSVLIYANAVNESNVHTFLYPGFLEELVELLETKDVQLVEIRAAAFRALTAVIHLDKNPHFPKKPGPRLLATIDLTGAISYHGLLPTIVRACIHGLTALKKIKRRRQPKVNPQIKKEKVEYDLLQQQRQQLQQLQLQQCYPGMPYPMPYPCGPSRPKQVPIIQPTCANFPLPLATALFSFLYHMASYDVGGEALVSCGMLESLLLVVDWPGFELEHITFVTRAVRVIDLITNIEMQSFQTHGGLASFVNRLNYEVNKCRKDRAFEIQTVVAAPPPPVVEPEEPTPAKKRDDVIYISDDSVMSTDVEIIEPPVNLVVIDDETDKESSSEESSCSSQSEVSDMEEEDKEALRRLGCNLRCIHGHTHAEHRGPKKVPTSCLPQRAALLKSMLNFLKKAIQDPSFSDSIRHVMEGSLPKSLRHIISNAEYYGPSLFLLATDVVTVFVFQEPSLLSSLQDNGLTEVVLQALLKKDVPATREVLGSLPNVFSALCLNARGLASFTKYDPFEKIFKVLLLPHYLLAMRRRRSNEPGSDTASNLGNAMDELMRHQPSLKVDAIKGIIKLLNELVRLGTDNRFVCWRANNKNETQTAPPSHRPVTTARNNAGSSDEYDDDEEEASTSSQHNTQRDDNNTVGTIDRRESVPLIDYIINIMKFIDAILSNNSTDDHCREFVNHGGLKPLLSILALPNLPVESPITTAAQSVASVCKTILNLAHETMVLQTGLEQLASVVDKLQPLQVHIEHPGGSVLLRELANCPNIDRAFTNSSYTPLLHAISAVHGYIVMLVHICRTGQSDIRTLLLAKWSQDTRCGKQLLNNLVKLYTALVWESTLLLALCTDDVFPTDSEFSKEDLLKLPYDAEPPPPPPPPAPPEKPCYSMEFDVVVIHCPDTPPPPPVVEEKKKFKLVTSPIQLRYIKSLLGASSRLGRALAELFGNLVKLCVGSPLRQRRGQTFTPNVTITSPEAKEVARVLSHILIDGFTEDNLIPSAIPKLNLTFLICSVGFTGPMLFDEKRCAFHLMLNKFVEEGGLKTFFDMFEWALAVASDTQDFPDGTGEFLDAWLMLLDKMVNPKNIIESPHVINNQSITGRVNLPDFEPIFYLIKIHKLAFEAIMRIWTMKPLPTYGVQMTESMMSILKHIIRNERELNDKYKERIREIQDADKTAREAASSSENSTTLGNHYLRQFIDMGFSEEQITEALSNTLSIDQATEYLLNHPVQQAQVAQAQAAQAAAIAAADENSMDVDAVVAEEPPPPRRRVDPDDESMRYQITNSPPCYGPLITKFSDTALTKTLYLMDQLPETITKGTELLVYLYRRNDTGWKKFLLKAIVQKLLKLLVRVRTCFGQAEPVQQDEVIDGYLSKEFTVILTMCCILLGDTYLDVREMLCMTFEAYNRLQDFMEGLLEIDQYLDERMVRKAAKTTPKWLSHYITFMDLFDKVSWLITHKKEMLQVTSAIWKWYDAASGKWNAYSVSNNKIIHRGYMGGDAIVHITCGRQRYTINFNCMTQVNEDTGNHRPVILSLSCLENYNAGEDLLMMTSAVGGVAGARERALYLNDAPDNVYDDVNSEYSQLRTDHDSHMPKKKRMSPSPEGEGASQKKQPKKDPNKDIMIGFSKYDCRSLVASCVRMMDHEVSLEKDALHALMKFVVRLTKDFKNAKSFAQAGGVKKLLLMQHKCGFLGFSTLAVLMLRHVLEEPKTLSLAIERVIVSRTIETIPPGYRDLVFLLRQMSSAVARDPDEFMKVAKTILRIDINALRRNTSSEDNRILVKSIAETKKNETMEETVSIRMVKEILQVIVKPCVHYTPESVNPMPGDKTRRAGQAAGSRPRRPGPAGSQPNAENTGEQCCGWHVSTTTNQDGNNKPLLPRATLLRFLAEAVRSYQTFAPLITDHVYKQADSPLIQAPQSALSFILDKFLPIRDVNTDRDVSSMARVLIASLASCNEQPSVLNTVVSEVKASISRAISLPESQEKHAHLQLLTGLIPTMIENCPTDPMQMKFNHLQPRRNDIFYVMVRKGLLNDLSKLLQHLDLASTHTVVTINTALKPLETLLRLTNAPGPIPLPAGSKKPASTPQRRSASISGSTPAAASVSVTVEIASGLGEASTSGAAAAAAAQSEPSTSRGRPGASSSDPPATTQASTSSNNDDVRDQLRSISPVTHAATQALSHAAAVTAELRRASAAIQGTLDEFMDHLLESTAHRAAGSGNNSSGNIPNLSFDEIARDRLMLDSSSSESGDSDSNDSDNEGEENEEGANTEGETQRSQVGFDEETRQYIEIYDHIYGRPLSPSIPELERDTDDVLTIRYTASTATRGATGASGVLRAPSGPITIHDRDTQHMPTLIPVNVMHLMSRPPVNLSGGSGLANSLGFGGQQFFNHRPMIAPAANANANSGVPNLGNAPEGQSNIFRDATRVVLRDNAFGIISSSDEQTIDHIFDQSGYLYGRSLAAALSTTPTALHWWLEEAKVLGIESHSDTCLALSHKLIIILEKYKQIEVTKSQLITEQKKKMAKRDADAKARNNAAKASGIPVLIPREQRDENRRTDAQEDGMDTDDALEQTHSSDNARNYVIGMDTDPEDNGQGTQSDTGTNPEESQNQAEESIGGSTNPNDAMSTTSASDLVSETDAEDEDMPTSPSSTLPPIPDSFDGDIDDEGDDEQGEGDYSSEEEGSEIDLVAMYEARNQRHAESRNDNASREASLESNSTSPLTVLGLNARTSDSHPLVVLGLAAGTGDSNPLLELPTPPPLPRYLSDNSRTPVPEPLARGSREDVSDHLGIDFAVIENILSHVHPTSSRESTHIPSAITSTASIITYPSSQSALNRQTRENADNRTNETQEEGAVGGMPSPPPLPAEQIVVPDDVETIPPTTVEISPELRAVLGDLEVPEGVDPSFLAALPSEMREEVIAEHVRLQRIRQRAQQNAIQVEHASIANVNPEFLAALPVNIQEEVLAQQRIEQQRQAAATANPNDPVDAAEFFQNLHPSLRQSILADMEDSQISVLPPQLVAEAQNLRREWESRVRQMNEDRGNPPVAVNAAPTGSGNNLTHLLGARFPTVHNLSSRPRWMTNSIWYNANQTSSAAMDPRNPSLMTLMERQGRPLLDHEALSSLLLLLFVDEPKFNTLRLHRVIRNLCCHVPTREWIIKALLSIIEKTSDAEEYKHLAPVRPQWLTFRLDTTLGARTNVFTIKRDITYGRAGSSTATSPTAGYVITINPQASKIICKHALELLITLAKSFPKNFLPFKKETKETTIAVGSGGVALAEMDKTKVRKSSSGSGSNGAAEKLQPTPSTSKAAVAAPAATNFWDIILKLDSCAEDRKSTPAAGGPFSSTSGMTSGHGPKYSHMNLDCLSFDDSPFGQLITILSYNIFRRSSQLTDKLLRLLSNISDGLPDERSAKKRLASKTKLSSSGEEEASALISINKALLPKSEEQLHLAVDVLTSTSCSEEGLEDATSLLLKLSKCSTQTRCVILKLLIRGAKDLAVTVKGQIEYLMCELQDLNISANASRTASAQAGTSSSAGPSTISVSDSRESRMRGGVLRDRFTSGTVVITAPVNVKQTRELQLASMVPLISKTSSQAFFLRILKVIIQIRASASKSRHDPMTRNVIKPLSQTLELERLWNALSECLSELELSNDHHAVLVLQPAVEAFFLVHASQPTNVQKKPSNAQQPPANSLSRLLAEANGIPPLAAMDDDDEDDDDDDDDDDDSSSSSDTSSVEYVPPEDEEDKDKPITSPEGTSSPGASAVAAAEANVDQKKFLQFAEKHRTVLNQILRQSTTHLSDGPFAVLVDHTRILDFDVKRKYFRTELERVDHGVRRDELAVHVRRVTVFEDSFRELYRRAPEEWKNRLYIVFQDEEGQDAGGLLREWYVIISREIFNPMYALFTVSPGDRVTYMINPSSHANPNHLCYFKFVGRVIAKAIHDNKLLECYFTRSFYKHILGIQVKYTDMESEDYDFYKGLVYLLDNHISELGYDVTFSLEVQEFGVTEIRDLIPNGRNTLVTEETKLEYIHLVCQLKMSGSIRQQLNAFLEGFYDIIPKRLISIFNEQELELLISGLPNVDIEDLRANTEYHKYQATSIQIQWFWRALRSFDQAARAKFLQFVTGTSKVPLQGFGALEGMNGTQKFQIHRDDRSTDRLPSAHTCFNQLDLPVYKTYDKLKACLLKAIHECSEGFGFA